MKATVMILALAVVSLGCDRAPLSTECKAPPNVGVFSINCPADHSLAVCGSVAGDKYVGCSMDGVDCVESCPPPPVPCAGYLVTSMCNMVDVATGLPEAGCHDDTGAFIDGCTYQAGIDVHSTKTQTVVCVKICH